MAVKSSTLFRRIPTRVFLSSHFSSLSCAINFQSSQEFDQPQLNSADFETKITFLRNKLNPDSLVSVLDSTPDLNSSIKLFKWASLQKRFNHTADTYHTMILKLGMAGNVEDVEGFCNEMIMEKCRGFDKSLLALIDSFLDNRRFSEALRVLYVMNSTNFKPSISVFNSLMCALVEGKRDFKDVLFVYKELVKAGIFPNIHTLNYLLEALFESERVDAAMDQYRRLDKKGCRPNIRTFQIVIRGLAAVNRVEESIIVLQEMFECGCEPDSCFYACIIPIFCSLHNLEIGLRLFNMMRDSETAPDAITYGAVIRCLCVYLHMDDAVKLFKEMVDSSLLVDHQVYTDIINGLCKLNKLREARNLLEEGNAMDTCLHNAILQSYCDHGNFVGAKGMFDEMFGTDMIDARSWNIIIRYLCEDERVNRAMEYLCRMVIYSFDPDSDTYSALILGYCKMGKVVQALDLFWHMRLKSWVLDSVSYAEFIECLCQRGITDKAAKVFCYMSSRTCALQPTSFSLLIEKICVSGGVNVAMKLLSLACFTGTASLCATYNSILRGLRKSGEEKYSLMILAKMIVIGCDLDVETYCNFIQCMSPLNRTDDCISAFNLMLRENLMPDSETLACLLSCLAKHSQLHLIFPSIDTLVSESEILDSTMYNILIDGLWREGYKSEAKRLLDLMLEKGWVPDATTHALLMGSIQRTETVRKNSVKEHFGIQDNVSIILEEGLSKT
ncbi:hypothetical protein C2S51_002601 [Perilla frutescens var. frutescens]|nr:hypothetical protein C2S51_002601 [Perilla frutescens var. frutescens]